LVLKSQIKVNLFVIEIQNQER